MATSVRQHRISAMENDRMRSAAELLLRARRNGTPFPELPVGLRPHTLEEAYAIQDIMGLAMEPIGGWKVGAPAPDATPLYGPMPLLGGYAETGQKISKHMRRMRGVEAEIAFRLGSDLPVRAEAYTREEVVAAIASAHPAIELLESAYVDPDKVDRLSMIGDLQMNGGFVYGAAYADWKNADLTQEQVTVSIDGAVRFEGTATNTAGTDLLRLVTWLANQGQERTGGLNAGDWITTGSWSGKALANQGSSVTVRFSHFGEIGIWFE
ncbi:2-keto-4-pentenoate hydratase [Acidipila rosea]|nr:fumarylacetoacetate hydrolase family protein [Acidipila rosea]